MAAKTKSSRLELLEEFRDSLAENAKDLGKYGVTAQYEEYLDEPEMEELPRMHQLNVEHFYRGKFGHSEEYRPLPTFTRHAYLRPRSEITDLKSLFAETLSSGKGDLKTPHRGAKRSFHVMIVGPAGSGKTTILARFARDSSAGDIPGMDEEDRIIHALNCRIFDPDDKVSIKDFLFRGMNRFPSDDSLIVGYDWMKENPEKVTFIVDSLDTLIYDLENEMKPTQPGVDARPSTTLFSIFTGKLFPGCSILSSSREHKIRNYTDDLRADRIISLGGLKKESIKRLVFGFLGKEEGGRVWEYLETKCPGLTVLCQTPVFLVFTLIGFRKTGVIFIPKTVSGVMVNLLQSLIHSEHAQKLHQTLDDATLSILQKMKKLSYNGTKERKVLFSEEDLKKAGLSTKEVTDLAIVIPGRVQTRQQVLEGESVTFFVHQSIEEVLCAMFVAEMAEDEFRKFATDFLHEPYYSVVRRMLCGILLDPEIYKEATKQLITASGDIANIRTMLCESMKEQLYTVEDERDLLDLMHAIHETSSGAKDIISDVMENMSFNEFPLNTLDMYVIASVLQYCSRLKLLELKDRTLTAEPLRQFLLGLTNTKLRIESLNVMRNKEMDVDGLRSIGKIVKMCKVRDLTLRECNLSPTEVQSLSESIEDAEIDRLDVSYNETLDESGFLFLGELVERIKVRDLNIRGCDLLSDDVEALNKSVGNAQIEVLSAGSNVRMGTDGLASLGNLVKKCKVQELNLERCKLNSAEVENLGQNLADAKIKKLNVSFNEKMGVDGLAFIGEVVTRCEVKELNIERCNMSSVKVEALFEALKDAKVDKIDVSHNKYMGENGWASLGNIIRTCRVAKLRMRLSYMKPNEAHAFSEGIGNAKLHEIDMNEMACSGFKDNVHFASAMNELLPKIIDRLDMRGCKLLKDDDLELQKKLNELYPTNLEVDLGDRRQTFVLTAKTPTWQQHTGGTFGPHGGTRTVAECSVTFPQGAFESENTVNIWLTVPPEDEPGPYITVSPTIRCVSERPMMKMAEVRLPLWISSDDDRVIVRIMRKPEEEEAQWEEIQTMQLSKVKERVLVFNCKFSIVKVVRDAINYVKELLGYKIDYYMDCVLYHDLQGNFTAIFHLDSKLVKDGLKEKLTDKRMVSVPKDFQKTVFHIDERVQVQLTVKKTEVSDTNRTQYQFTREKDEFDLDKHFLRNPHHFDTLLDPNPVGNPVLQIKYKYNVKNSAVRVVKVPFRLDWSVQAEEVKELKARQEKDIDKTRTDKGQTSQPNYSNLTNCQIIYSNNNSSGPATDSSPHPAATMTVNDNRMTAKNIATGGSSQKIHETRGTNIIAGSLQTRIQEASVAGSSQDPSSLKLQL